MVCLYEDIGFDGELWPFGEGTDYVGDDVDDRASSVFNNTAQEVTLYSEPDFGGLTLCLQPQTGISDLGDVELDVALDDEISSLAIGFCE